MSNPHKSQAASMLRPGIAGGIYPERRQTDPGWLQRTGHSLVGILKTFDLQQMRFLYTLATVHDHARIFEKLNDAALTEEIRHIRRELHLKGLTDKLIVRAFALIRETAGRTINMRHFDTQLIGGWIMIHGGLAEMETGEGKTLTAILAAGCAALAGIPVHLVTVNDYLVSRDAEWMEPVYKALGLSVGAVTADMEEDDRRAGYACDIAYCTNKQLAFDYLRDRILLGNDQGRIRLQLEKLHDDNARTNRLFLPGLCFAIIDEADSVLVDEARTPLIISRELDSSEEKQTYLQAVDLADKLQNGVDFTVDQSERRVQLSEKGSERLADAAKQIGGVFSGIRQREELVRQALSASYLYLRDRHYLVQDDKVLIIDENTGRVMPDRSWERGLHQMIELKENCTVTGQKEHMARLTYQRFFRRYLRLAGMTGTASEVRRELWSIYHLPVLKVVTNRPCRRKSEGQRMYANNTEKWSAVVDHIRKIHLQGRPVLVGTRSVAASEHLSALLDENSLPHQVLNARQDKQEAEVVARAGEKGCITVATNMAGRGTDIPLGPGVVELGGLHIIATECNEAQRIDRQLYGRCGRQGDPGSYKSILSLDDELIDNHTSETVRRLLARLIHKDRIMSQRISLLAIHLAQSARERRYLRMRRDLLQLDKQLAKMLAFSGCME